MKCLLRSRYIEFAAEFNVTKLVIKDPLTIKKKVLRVNVHDPHQVIKKIFLHEKGYEIIQELDPNKMTYNPVFNALKMRNSKGDKIVFPFSCCLNSYDSSWTRGRDLSLVS